MTIIATKDFIAAVAREGHRDMFARLAAEQQCGDLGGICERLPINFGELWDDFEGIVLAKPERLVLGPKMLGDSLRMHTLVIACVGKAN